MAVNEDYLKLTPRELALIWVAAAAISGLVNLFVKCGWWFL